MRPVIIADNQDITCEGLLSLIRQSGLADHILLTTSRNQLLSRLKEDPDGVVILDYTLFDFSGPHEMLVMREGFAESSWLLFSEELSEPFIRQV